VIVLLVFKSEHIQFALHRFICKKCVFSTIPCRFKNSPKKSNSGMNLQKCVLPFIEVELGIIPTQLDLTSSCNEDDGNYPF
jgi:hypothetical protein